MTGEKRQVGFLLVLHAPLLFPQCIHLYLSNMALVLQVCAAGKKLSYVTSVLSLWFVHFCFKWRSSIRKWNLHNGYCLNEIRGHEAFVYRYDLFQSNFGVRSVVGIRDAEWVWLECAGWVWPRDTESL